MENLGFKERRAFPRFSVKVLLKFLDLNLNNHAESQTNNVSAKGLCLVTDEDLDAETPLDIWLEMPDNGEQIYVKGRVVWSSMIEPNKYRIGVNLENTELNPILLALKAIQVRIKHY